MFYLREKIQDMLTDLFAGGVFDDVGSVLSLNPSTGIYETVWNVAVAIYDGVCVPIGTALVLIYFLVNIIEKVTQQNFDLEYVIKSLLKLFVGLYLIQNGLSLMTTIYSLSFSFLNEVVSNSISQGELQITAQTAFKQLTGEEWNQTASWGFIKSFNHTWDYITIFIPWLGIMVLKIVVRFVCYTRLIEFYIKTATAPIALSDFFTEGMHSNGWKFIKGYIAIALQAGVIMLATVIFNALSAGIYTSGEGWWAFIIKYLALGFATVGVMLKSLSLTKEIVGAN